MFKTKKAQHQAVGGTPEAPTVSREDVARMAYELYVRRGRVDGRELDDWIKAEAILKDRHGGAP